MIKIYNSLTNKLEEFKTIKENEVSMYVCGSTVYDDIHIGNARPVIFFDTVARFFKILGYKVTFVSNFTDIDDKIIKKAKSEGVSEQTISERYIKSIRETYKKLNCLPHDKNPRVTESIKEIVDFIDLLVKKEGAYIIDKDVYFDVAKINKYGILSGQTVENLMSGARIETNDKKHNPVDFALWKETNEGLRWDSPWGEGRPGWHTECVVMIHNIFKEKIDIHGGGVDLKFPHHDNEIAQSICAYDNMIANYWIHNGRIDLSGEKMSKSLGNVVWAKDLADNYGYGACRYLILNVPYRQPLSYKKEVIDQAITEYEKISRSYISLFRKIELNDALSDNIVVKNEELVNIYKEFIEYMSNDFNTPNAISTIIRMTKTVNNYIRNKDIDNQTLLEAQKVFYDMLWTLGFEPKIDKLTASEKDLVKSWHKARNEKNFNLADELRIEITKSGIIL